MRFKRILASVLTVACLVTCFTATASAKNIAAPPIGDTASPQYSIATSTYSELNFIGTTAECVSKADGLNTVKISVVQILEKYSGWLWVWDEVVLWTKTEKLSAISLTNKKSDLPSGKYRLRSEFTLTNSSGNTETITVYSDIVSI